MVNKHYIKSAVSNIAASNPNELTLREVEDAVCSRCQRTCNNNLFCSYMFNTWVIKEKKVETFMDVLEAFIDNIDNPTLTRENFRTLVCDTCFKCKTTYDRAVNTTCALAWFEQLCGRKPDNSLSERSNNVTRLHKKIENGPKCMCSEAVLKVFRE